MPIQQQQEWNFTIYQLKMPKNEKKTKSIKDEALQQALEKDERFSGIMKDPVGFHWFECDIIEI